MIEPWFNPQVWAWVPGTVFGVSMGLWGTAVGVLAPRGKAKALVLGSGVVLLVAALGSLVAGILAIGMGQPYGVWYALMLPGAIGLFVPGPLLRVVATRCREADERKMEAGDRLS